MKQIRLSAVSYLNTKPLVAGLENRPDLFSVRFDLPSTCAALLHAGDVDLGLIPAIEYQRGDAYWIVPDLAIGSDGAVASVAVFSRVPIGRVRTLALDTSSRTSAALTEILCARHWGIRPTLASAEPNLAAMLDRCDAALLIGDLALVANPEQHDAIKIDLGLEWRAMTGLPFVYAVWAGRAGVASAAHVRELQAARDRGIASLDRIAEEEGGGDAARAALALGYLRDNLRHHLGDAEVAGLQRFHALAAELGLVPGRQPLRFYP
jgi:chorismate dehydratase